MSPLDSTRILLVASVAAGALLTTVPAAGQTPVSGPVCPPNSSCVPTHRQGTVDPKFAMLERVLETEGPNAALFGPDGLADDADLTGAAATLRFDHVLSPAELDRLARAGVRFTREDGKLVRVGTIYSAFVEFDALDVLENDTSLVRAEAVWRPVTPPPLEVTAEKVGAVQARALPELGVDGSGVVIGDIDGGVDPLHPHLFKPDGGQYAWLDDGNGEFRPGEDGVDLNEDGEIGSDEFLRVLDATIVDFRGLQNDDGILQPDVDWLYVDTNNDGKRNVGVEDGFTEDDLAYGEPLFVADDVDRDGVLEPAEKLVRLGTSKIRKYVLSDRTYVRGEDLIEGSQDEAARYAGHGTSVSSILAGGAAGYQSRVGLAPGAEVIMYSSGYSAGQGDWEDKSPQLSDIQSAIDDGVGILLHEWTDPYTAPHDGSGNVEAAMGEARAAGIVQVNPLGNLNLAQKHTERTVPSGGTTELAFEVDEGFQYGREIVPYTVAYASIFWRSTANPTLVLVAPDGTEVQAQNNQQVQIGDDVLWATHEETSRGTRQTTLYLYSQDQQSSLAQGEWTLRIEDVDVETRFIGRITDYYSSWSQGIGWNDFTEGIRTLVYPSTADSAVGVAAYGGRHDQSWDESYVDELRNFSGRGPRFDDAPAVDIAAPDDPYAAMAATPRVIEAGYGRSWFSTFGGTSGAGPHVAAAFALLLSQDPGATPDDVERALYDAADQQGLQPSAEAFPSPLWGHGKVDAFEALFGMEAYERNESPAANLDVVVGDAIRFDASESNDPDGDSMQFRFDFDYDGEWDTEWLDEDVTHAAREFFDGPGTYTARVSVRDAVGASRGALAGFEIAEMPTEPDPDPDPDGEGPDVDVTPDDPDDDDSSGGDEAGDEAKDLATGCGGCATASNSGLDAGWLALLALVMFRRRR